MGCPNAWGTVEQGGSDVPCVDIGQIYKDGNNEDQKNGTYYHFQAASVGTGSTITTDNANVPDTFCPLGWQLPYGGIDGEYYSQSKSWKYLLDRYNIVKGEVYWNGLANYPFSYVVTGQIHFGSGRLSNSNKNAATSQQGNMVHWTSTAHSTNNQYVTYVTSGTIQTGRSETKIRGKPIRCVTELKKVSESSAPPHISYI